MSVISKEESERLEKEFSKKLVDDVELVVFTQEVPCVYCRETVEVANELAGTSDKIRASVHDFVKDHMRASELRIDKIPAIAIVGKRDYGIRFYGIPSGYEFASLVSTIVDVSRGESGLSERSKEALKGIERAGHIEVLVTPTCPNCPSAVRLAHKAAIESDMIWSDMIEATEFPQIAQKYALMTVPKVVVNEKHEATGVMSEDLFIRHVVEALAQKEPVQPR